jgi:predicted nucleic acid-binding Zn ribbon protein
MRKADEIISLLFKQRFGVDFVDNARSSSELFNSWEEIVCQVWPRGDNQKKEDVPAAAVHSRIKELERGVLIVEADHPGWIQILQTKQAELLQAIQSRYPKQDIRGIAFRLSKGRG